MDLNVEEITMSNPQIRTRAAAIAAAIALGVVGVVAIPESAQAAGTTYYVNNQSGSGCSNTGPGTSTATPWCDFTNVNSHTFVAGDVIALARGATWTTPIHLTGTGTSTNWITLGAYGSGALPIIRGTNQATDRTVILTNPDYWKVQDLEVSNAGMGIIVNYTTLGHQGLQFSDIYAHDINAIFHSSPAQTDYSSIQNSAGIIIGGLNAPPVPTASQWVVKNITVTNYRTNNTNPFYIWTMQSGGLYSTYPVNSVQNVTVQDSSFTNMPAPGFATEAAENINFFSNKVDCSGHLAEAQGTTCFFLWRTSNITLANNIFENMPDTGSNDETVIDAEGYVDHVITRGNYFTNNAGAGTEYLQLTDRPGDYSTNHEASDNAFASNGIGSGKAGTSLEMLSASGNPITGTLSNNLYAEANGLATGPLGGFTQTNNLAVTKSNLSDAPAAFSGTQSSGNESYELDSSGSYTNLTYNSTTSTWTSAAGSIGQFDANPTATATQWISRTWTAPSTGTISIRGRAFKSVVGGDGALLRITKNGSVIWPTAGGSYALGASDQTGTETALDGVTVNTGDKIRFEINSGSAGNATNDATSWAPSLSYITPPSPAQSLISSATPGALRNDTTSLVGMAFTTGTVARSVGALGRYFNTGNSASHTLSLYSNSGSTLLGSCTVTMSSGAVDSLGFDYCTLGTPVALAASTPYYLVSSETSGGDTFSNDDSSVSFNSGSRNSSVYQNAGTWGTGSGSGSYGPVNLIYASNVLTAATAGTIRNNYSGNVGMKYTTGSLPYYVTSLGRYFVTGNTGSHTLAIYRSGDGALIASCNVAMASGSADALGFKYCALAAPAVLAPSTAYYIVTNETSGGDSWSDDNSTISLSTGARNSSIYQSGGTWAAGPGTASYGPVNIR
jgi:hypothetical protein